MAVDLATFATEEQFQRTVEDYARLMKWRIAHFRPARTATGWKTAVSGDGRGFPDLVLVRGKRVVYIELKSEKGRLSADQAAWITALQGAKQECYVFHPSDWGELSEVLK
jgi:hypothetical protein